MRTHRRAALALTGGLAVAGTIAGPAAAEEAAPTVSIACIDRTIAAAPVEAAGLGIAGILPLLPPPPPPGQLPVPLPAVTPTNPAVAVITLTNPGDGLFTLLVTRDADLPVTLAAGVDGTSATAFEVADGGTSVFRVTDPAGTEVAMVASTGDCTPPAGWCDPDRAPQPQPGVPVAAVHADVCPVEGDEVFGVPEASATPVPTGRIVDGEPEVMAAQLAQTATVEPGTTAVPISPTGAIAVPAPSSASQSNPAGTTSEEVAQPITAEPQLALSGSRTQRLAQLATLLLGTGVAVVGVGRRRVDVELDGRASAAMARISAAASPLSD